MFGKLEKYLPALVSVEAIRELNGNIEMWYFLCKRLEGGHVLMEV